MSRLMLDSTTASDIPYSYEGRPLELVAGYLDDPRVPDEKRIEWREPDWALFPAHIRRVKIAFYTDRYDAQVLDVEEGNANARQAVPWIAEKWRRGEVPTIYCYSGAGPVGYRINDVRAECDKAGVKRPLFWIAHWAREYEDFDPTGDPSIIALQYDGSSETGGHFDASAVADYWPGIDPDRRSDERMSDEMAEAVKGIIRSMSRSPEGTLLVRDALTRTSDDALTDLAKTQLAESDKRTRRWIVGL